MSKAKSAEDLAERMLGGRKPVSHVPSILDAPSEPPSLHREIPVSKIDRSPFQRRSIIDPDHVQDLAKSVTDTGGLLQDVLVREMPDGRYELVAGENRWEAYKLLGKETIPAKVRQMSDKEAARALTADNNQHKPLTDWETYRHLDMLFQNEFVSTDEEAGEIIGRPRSYVTKTRAFSVVPQDAVDILNQYPDAISADVAQSLRASGFPEKHPDLVTDAIQAVAEKKIRQNGILGFIKEEVRKRENRTKESAVLKDNQFVHKNRKVRVVIKNGVLQISAKGLKADFIEEWFMKHLDECF